MSAPGERPDSHIAVVEDITERKRAETEQRRIEEQMRYVQQLESLGVLAGGIAHDFNNMLMSVLGNAGRARPRRARIRLSLPESHRRLGEAARILPVLSSFSCHSSPIHA